MIYKNIKSQDGSVNCLEITIEKDDKAQFRKKLDILKDMIEATKQDEGNPKTAEEKLEVFNRFYAPPLRKFEKLNYHK